MAPITILETVYNEQLCVLYRVLVEAVGSAKDHDAEFVAAMERFRLGVELLKRIDAKAREIVENSK